MYFGLYQINHRQRQFDSLPYETPCAGPSLLEIFLAWLRRVL